MVLIYVDDIIIAGNDSKKLLDFITYLNTMFALKDLGPLHHFLGIEVHRDKTGLYLSQAKYIKELLTKTEMLHLKLCSTPMTVGKALSKTDGEPLLQQPTAYCSIIRGLQYLTHTWPDLSFTVNKLSQYLQASTTTHKTVTKRVLRYLNGTINHDLHIKYSDHLAITGYSDVDCA
uniref:Reverse transcriptase Ty1/copia-type domain-containing protein n=1 Tax=Cannabis sativa TaxID=3483 RepID=A0A803Q5T4_CANSA